MGGQGGEYEPRDSRNVTGTSTNQTGDRWSVEAQDGNTPNAAGDTEGQVSANAGATSAYGREDDVYEVFFDPDPELEQTVTGGESEVAYGEEDDGDYGSEGAAFADQIEEHMEVVGSDGGHVGTVDDIDGERIKLTRSDSGTDSDGGHRYIPIDLVAGVEMGRVRLNTPAAQARARTTGG